MRRQKMDQDASPQIGSPENNPELAAPPETPEMIQQPAPAVAPPQTPSQPAPSSGNSTARSLWRIFVFLFKLGLFLTLLAALAAGVYFGWPVIYNRYILPLQNNTAQLASLQTQQQESQQQLSALQTQLPVLSTEQAQQALALTGLAPRMDTLEGVTENHTLDIATLIVGQANLQTTDQARQTELKRETALLRAMELLSRARLFLYQSNFGLARQDVQTARDLLAGVQAAQPLADGVDLGEVVQRLNLTISRLPDFPVAASDDLDIAWQILLQGKLQPSPTPYYTPEGEATPTPTPFPPPAFDTPGPTPVPTATP